MSLTERKMTLPALLVAGALGAGCAAIEPQSDATNVVNDPKTAGTGVKEYGSQACREANIRVVRTSSLGMIFNPTTINGYHYPGYTQAYTPLFNLYRSNPGYLASTTLRSGTGELFTLMPGSPPEQVGKGLGALGGGVVANMVGGGSVQVAVTVLGAIGGYVLGDKVDNKLQTQWLAKAERCARDVEDGAYNRKGKPLPEDLGQPHPLAQWGGRIDHLLPGYRR